MEEERAKNMNVAIGSVIDGMKEDKMKAMKRIKKLQHEKKKNEDKSKKVKGLYHDLKKDLEGGMQSYKELQEEFDKLDEGDEKDKLEESMADLLEKIEKKRGKLVEAKEALAKLKARSVSMDEELMEVSEEISPLHCVLLLF